MSYTCGPYGQFRDASGNSYKAAVVECAWNRSWVPHVLEECVGERTGRINSFLMSPFPASHCQVVPFPPKETGILFLPEPNSSFNFNSEFASYNPQLPFTMSWPEGFCDGLQKLLLVGNVLPGTKKPQVPEIYLIGENEDYHVIHLMMDIRKETIFR